MSVREDLNSSNSVISASSWFVTWGIFVHEFIRYLDDSRLTLGISFNSTSPNSEWWYSCAIVSSFLISFLSLLLDWFATNSFISFSVTLPCLSLPSTLAISIPSSLANFLAFGDANVFVEKSLTITFFCLTLVLISTFSSFISLFFDNWGSSISSWFSFTSISKILCPSETLSPIFISNPVIIPSSKDGISTLDLSLSIVISGSFF